MYQARYPHAVRFSHLCLLLVALVELTPRLSAGNEGKGDGDAHKLATGEIASLVNSVVRQLEGREGPRFWTSVSRLEALGTEAIPALRAGLEKAGERGRLACAKALLALEEQASSESLDAFEGSEAVQKSLEALEQLTKTAKAKEVRVAAMDLLGNYGDPEEVLPYLLEHFEKHRRPTGHDSAGARPVAA